MSSVRERNAPNSVWMVLAALGFVLAFGTIVHGMAAAEVDTMYVSLVPDVTELAVGDT